ncbi:hypothetical protein M3182_13035 [Mesobacillus maritimus]|nr:hypothetical protein [Mesobacillus maritimus]MCM3586657.1 hypothetical protein [Mesobacillus maritimus]MCM3668590.1 hypothetical protein [Mesobacillus maritimus]
MNIAKFEQSIQQLFDRESLEEFRDDFGFTNQTISTIGYSTNLSIRSN